MSRIIPRDFQKRQHYYSKLQRLPLRWQREYHLIIAPLYLMLDTPYKARNVVELGCADGRLAIQALHDLPTLFTWHGYDLAEQWIKQSQHHPRYTPQLLTDWLWNFDIERFHIFVCSHTLEHLFPDEVEKLAAWLGRYCKTGIILNVPSPARRYGQHVLGKPAEWIINLLDRHGFRLVWQTGGWVGWFVKA